MGRPTEIVVSPSRGTKEFFARDGTPPAKVDAPADPVSDRSPEPVVVVPATEEVEAPIIVEPVTLEPDVAAEEPVEDAPDPPRTPSLPPRPDSPRVRTEAQRDFIVAYRGEFVGHYRSPRRVLARTAFRIVAQQMKHQLGDDFDLDALQIFKPVPLECIHREAIAADDPGAFRWFAPSAPRAGIPLRHARENGS